MWETRDALCTNVTIEDLMFLLDVLANMSEAKLQIFDILSTELKRVDL